MIVQSGFAAPFRREFKHDEEGTADQLAAKAFGIVGNVAGIKPTPLPITLHDGMKR